MAFLIDITEKAKNDLDHILIITAVWMLMIILVNPIGDFPLNDDWAYGYSVKVLMTQGHFQLSGWTATNLISQVFWGALFCLPFGFSFTALRLSTLTLGLIGVIAIYFILREVNLHRKIAFLGALLVAINPIYFGLANTFMNDVPFVAVATVSIYFLIRGLKYSSLIELTIGIIISYIAILTRQIGLAIPLAFGCAYIAKRGGSFLKLLSGFLPALLGFGIQFGYQKWLQLDSQTPVNYNNQIKTILIEISKGLDNITYNFFSIILISLLYLGLFLFPFIIIYITGILAEISFRKRILFFFTASFFFLIIMILLLSQYGLMPIHGNILGDFGIGPVILKGSELPQAPKLVRLNITIISALGAALLLHCLFYLLYKIFSEIPLLELRREKGVLVFILSLLFLSFFPLPLVGLGPFGFYDRYLIFLLPLFMMLLSVSPWSINNWNIGYKCLSFVIIAILFCGWFTIAATHDYFAWNRARWKALYDLMHIEQVSPGDIDGGFEFNGWYLYDSKYQYDPTLVKSWYWVNNDRYAVSFNPISGYEEVNRYPYGIWLPFGRGGNILVLKRTIDPSL